MGRSPGEERDDVIQLPDGVRVRWVDASEAGEGGTLGCFEDAVQRCVANGGDVGLDIEWRPVDMGSEQAQVAQSRAPYCALLQVGFRGEVFLLDLMVEVGCGWFWQRVSEALCSLLGSRKVRKLGFGFVDDFARLMASHVVVLPELRDGGLHNLVEINILAKLSEPGGKGPLIRGGGLAAVSLSALGKRLDKSMQVSDWERRPLLEDQFTYAAIDCWVLLPIADALLQVPVHGMSVLPDGIVLPIGTGAVEADGVVVEDDPGMAGEEIGKCVSFIVRESQPVLIVTRGGRKVESALVAGFYHVPKRQVRMATPRECVQILGHRPGSIGPLGIRFPRHVEILLDPCLSELDEKRQLVCSGGQPSKVFRTTVNGLRKLTGANWLQKVSPPSWSESIDVKQNGFVVDNMMQKCARWLRLLGFNTVYTSIKDMDWVLAIALEEKRVIITRDDQLVSRASRTGVPCLAIVSNITADQVVEVARAFAVDLNFDHLTVPSRCVRCNSASFQNLDREKACGLVPTETLKHFSDFWQCRGCRKVFWKGAHFKNQLFRIGDLKRAVEELVETNHRHHDSRPVALSSRTGVGPGR